MSKEKILFDRNNIFVAIYNRETNHENEIRWNSYAKKHDVPNKNKGHYERKVCESPLGFYYEKNVWVDGNANFTYSTYFQEVIIFVGKTEVWIRYPIKCNEVSIGFDQRPWEICIGDKSLKPHMIKALERSLNEAFGIAVPIKTWKRSKDRVFKDVFGDVNGYQTLSNEIKIISHGFDPRVSFRKRKD